MSDGSAASSIDPATWDTYQNACGAVKKFGADGIGIVLQDPIIGVDLDHVVENGKLNDFAREVVNKCRSYTEYSPSGTGLHIYLKGKLNHAIKTKGFEAYQNGRFFTVTERTLLSLPIRTVTEEFIGGLLPEGSRERRPISEVIKNIQSGTRNTDLFKLAASLRDKGYTVEAIYGLLEDKAKALNFPLDELELLCRSAGRYQPSVPSLPVAEEVVEGSDSFLEFMSDESVREAIIPGVVGKGTINIIAGVKGSLKSWISLDLGLALATGTPWLNRFPTMRQKVLIFDQERDKKEMQRRFKLLAADKEISFESLEEYLIPKVGTHHKINLEQSYIAIEKKIEQYRPDVLIIDSLKAFQSLNIKEDRDMQMVFEQFKLLRQKFNLTIFILHHETKGAYVRAREQQEVTAEYVSGSSVITEVPEGVFIVAPLSKTESMLYHDKNSCGGKNLAPILVRIMDVVPDQKVRVEAN